MSLLLAQTVLVPEGDNRSFVEAAAAATAANRAIETDRQNRREREKTTRRNQPTDGPPASQPADG